MQTIKLGVLIKTKPLLDEIVQLKLKAKDAFKLLSAIKKIGAELSIYEEAKTNLIKSYGKDLGEGNIGVEPGTEEYDHVVRELEDLASKDINLDIEKISVDSLGDTEIEIYKLLALDYIFE